MEIKENQPLSEFTTFRIGGNADFFVDVESETELTEVVNFAREKSLPVQIIGGGSNLLISDEGFRGLVIHNKIKKLAIEDSGLVTVGAGESWDDVVVQTIEKGLAGIECLSGVPGSSGGAVVQNIGAYGQTLGDRVVQVQAVEVATGIKKQFSAVECEFVYRNSWFKKNPNKYIVASFQIKLEPLGAPTITYPDVKKYFEGKPNPSLAQLREHIIQTRGNKGYLIMPEYEIFATAGSFFKNPIVTQVQYERLIPILGDISLNRFWETPTGIKLAAAFLMQEAGFGKGYREGNVGISPKHSLSLINLGGAKARDVKALAEKIKNSVSEKFGVTLEEEVLFVGEI